MNNSIGPLAGPPKTSFREIIRGLGAVMFCFGIYYLFRDLLTDWFQGHETPWGYRHIFATILFGAGFLCLLLGKAWPWSAASCSSTPDPSPLWDGERVLKQGHANLVRGWLTIGGWLFLTDQRLLFLPHGLHLRREPVSISLLDVLAVRPAMTLGIIPNGLHLVASGGDQRFLVFDRGSWLAEIRHAGIPLCGELS